MCIRDSHQTLNLLFPAHGHGPYLAAQRVHAGFEQERHFQQHHVVRVRGVDLFQRAALHQRMHNAFQRAARGGIGEHNRAQALAVQDVYKRQDTMPGGLGALQKYKLVKISDQVRKLFAVEEAPETRCV